MNVKLQCSDEERLRQAIVSKCSWSDTYSSLKQIIQKTRNRLPLLVAFTSNLNQTTLANENIGQTVFFFDRNISKKNLFVPLKQSESQASHFEIYPNKCTFALTDSFKGVFEFVRNGQRFTHIYTYLEQLLADAASFKCDPNFMSRDPIRVHCLEANSGNWISKEYPQGSIFQAQRIHHLSNATQNTRIDTNDYLECINEEGYTVFLKLKSAGRFSLIKTLINHQYDQADKFLYSTQTTNIGKLIQYLTFDKNKNGHNCYLRLVRGSVPYNFFCQYLKFISQHKYDVLMGLTQQGLVIEWNLESHAPCRFATNLDDVLSQLYGTWDNETLQNYVDVSRTHYRENFPINIQILSKRDCTEFLQYWKCTGDLHHANGSKLYGSDQIHNHFDLIASIQDLSDDFQVLSAECLKIQNYHHNGLQSAQEIASKRTLSAKRGSKSKKQSKLIHLAVNRKRQRTIFPIFRLQNLLLTNFERPFDDSIYDSNRNHQSK